MANYFRLQDAGISFKDMCSFTSADGGDGEEEVGGLCVSMSPDKFGGAEGAYGAGRQGEVVILKGRKLAEIYDGYRIQPTAEVARFSLEVWEQMVKDESAWDYEDWS
jgi:hypothetical protein